MLSALSVLRRQSSLNRNIISRLPLLRMSSNDVYEPVLSLDDTRPSQETIASIPAESQRDKARWNRVSGDHNYRNRAAIPDYE